MARGLGTHALVRLGYSSLLAGIASPRCSEQSVHVHRTPLWAE